MCKEELDVDRAAEEALAELGEEAREELTNNKGEEDE